MGYWTLIDGENRPTNYTGPMPPTYLFRVYINCYSLFDLSGPQFGLERTVSDLDLFFWDELNTTAYATDDQIGALLEALNHWYVEALPKAQRRHREDQADQLRAKLARLEENQ